MAGIITGIQRFCLHDGPGVRTTVFMKGCPLRCRWCHNPETQLYRVQPMLTLNDCVGCGACERVCPRGCHRMDETERFNSKDCIGCMKCAEACPTGAIAPSGQVWEVQKLADRLERDRPFWGETGGVTVSGGEPTFQHEFLTELLTELKKRGISTCVETCGYCAAETIKRIVPLTDHFLWDIKDTDEERHKSSTGVSLAPIVANLRTAAAMGAEICVRGILVEGINAETAHVQALAQLARSAGAKSVKLLRFHPYYSSKLVSIGRPQERMGAENAPEKEKMEALSAMADRIFEAGCL